MNESQVLVCLHYGSFQFLSVTETSPTSGSIRWHTHKHGRACGYLDEAQFTFNLIKSESEFYTRDFKKSSKVNVIYNYTTKSEFSATIRK